MGSPLWFIFAAASVAAFLHLRLRSRNRFAGGFARLILGGVGCFFLVCGLLEFSAQRELKPENVPIRVDLLFTIPAACILLAVGLVAYVYGLRSAKVVSSPQPPSPEARRVAGAAEGTLGGEKADERLSHLLPKRNSEQKN